MTRVAAVLAALALCGCGGERERGPVDAGPDAGFDAGPDPCTADADGDGIPDFLEGDWDLDEDGIANDEDLDSDGDGISDEEEHAGRGCAPSPDHDGDGISDPGDTDSDGDSVPDAEEAEHGFDRTERDTNGDGCIDYAELVLDGCSDPRDSVVVVDCDLVTGLAVFTVPSDAPDANGFVSATITPAEGNPLLPEHFGLRAEASAASPAGSARPDRDGFHEVHPGARLTFRLVADRPPPMPALFDLNVTGEHAGVVAWTDAGRVLVLPGTLCPALI